MKLLIIFSALVALIVADKIDYYTTGNDYLDIDSVMKNPELVKNFVDCFVDHGPCDSLSESYKENMADAIATACRRCNNPQKHLWNKFLASLKEDYPTLYFFFIMKYDPHNIYMENMEKAVADY